MCFADLEMAYNCVHWGVLWAALWEQFQYHYGDLSCPYITRVLCLHSRPEVKHVSSWCWPLQGLSLVTIKFVILIISRHTRGEKRVRFGHCRIISLLFADEMVLLDSSDCDIQHVLLQFAARWEVNGMRIRTSREWFSENWKFPEGQRGASTAFFR